MMNSAPPQGYFLGNSSLVSKSSIKNINQTPEIRRIYYYRILGDSSVYFNAGSLQT